MPFRSRRVTLAFASMKRTGLRVNRARLCPLRSVQTRRATVASVLGYNAGVALAWRILDVKLLGPFAPRTRDAVPVHLARASASLTERR
jgi:hypothetical protein